MDQVPQTEVFKRKRSRPSDWWANASIIASTPPRLPVPPRPAQDESEPGPSKKRGRRSIEALGERAISDSPAAANRGRPAKKKRGTGDVDDENAVEDDAAKDRPAKVTRSSRTVGPSNDVQSKQREKNKGGEKSAKEQGINVPKRRGRPSTTALNKDQDAEGPVEKASRRTRRGRAEGEAESSEDEDIVGRRPAAATTREISQEPIAPAPTRRTRRSDAELLDQDPTALPRDEEPERGRPRTRRSDASINKEQVTQEVPHQEERRRKRTRGSDVPPQGALDSSAMKDRPKRGRKPSQGAAATSFEVETASSKLTKAPNKSKKVDRSAPSKSTKGQKPSQTKSKPQPSRSSVQDATGSNSSQARRKSSKRTSEPQPARKRKEVEKPEGTPKKRQRLTVEAREAEVEAPKSPEPDMLYQYLRPVQRRVSRQIINSKWEALTPACIEPISQFLQDVQRPVVAHLNDEKKKTQASTALQMVSRRLVSKLSKGLPFPQATRSRREDDFDFEKILDHNRALEAQLTPALHGNALLEAELAKEAAWLEADQEALAELERNAKSESSARNTASRKMHSVLQPHGSLLETEVLVDNIGMEDNRQHVLPLDLRVQNDEALQGLIKGLHGHVETIKGNMKQVDGISEAIVRSRAAVQSTLFSHLGDMQYEEVILGPD